MHITPLYRFLVLKKRMEIMRDGTLWRSVIEVLNFYRHFKGGYMTTHVEKVADYIWDHWS